MQIPDRIYQITTCEQTKTFPKVHNVGQQVGKGLVAQIMLKYPKNGVQVYVTVVE